MAMPKNKLVEVLPKLVGLLEPLSAEERLRVIHWALTLLGQTQANLDQGGGGQEEEEHTSGLGARAKAWLKKSKISASELEEFFHQADGTWSTIGDVPGKNNREKTLNAYVLEGLRVFLSTDQVPSRTSPREIFASHQAAMTVRIMRKL